MNEGEIEEIIRDCKAMASEPAFNLEEGNISIVNYKRYSDLLEELLRGSLKYYWRNE